MEWLRYFGLNFFSKKYALQSKNRSWWNSGIANELPQFETIL